MIEPLIFLLLWAGFVIMWFRWSAERDRRRDYASDLCSIIHDYDLDSRDLRRSLMHKEIRKQVERNYQKDGTMDFIEEYKDRDRE